jgi:23S rRNA pseudouridine2604 synthase
MAELGLCSRREADKWIARGWVRVASRLSAADLRRLNHGLVLDGVALKPAEVGWINDDQLRFVLREGRKRQIPRMCELVGLRVLGLKRVRIGQMMLGHLPAGQWRYLGPDERFGVRAPT